MHGSDVRGVSILATAKGRFGRLFPSLPPRVDGGAVDLTAVSKKMFKGVSPDNPAIPAGFTFLGQFLDHDLTFDPTPLGEKLADPGAIQNFRTPLLDLDSIYGAGPETQPYLYDGDGKFVLGHNKRCGNDPEVVSEDEDLPRLPSGRAIIGDPRNDENLIIAQLHLIFLKGHNKFVDRFGPGSFYEARQALVAVYQQMILDDYLPRTVGEDAFKQFTLSRNLLEPSIVDTPFMPLEFSVAAFRFGHSQVRGGYNIQVDSKGAPVGQGLFSSQVGGRDLQGGQCITPELQVDWSLFFGDSSMEHFNNSLKIDHVLSGALQNLPANTIAEGNAAGAIRSLASRNLIRGDKVGLPSGQAVANFLGVDVLTPEELWKDVMDELIDVDPPAPLWYYILREAAVFPRNPKSLCAEDAKLQEGETAENAKRNCPGSQLGPVGGRIVLETFVAMLMADPASVLSGGGTKPSILEEFRDESGKVTMAKIIEFAQGA